MDSVRVCIVCIWVCHIYAWTVCVFVCVCMWLCSICMGSVCMYVIYGWTVCVCGVFVSMCVHMYMCVCNGQYVWYGVCMYMCMHVDM